VYKYAANGLGEIEAGTIPTEVAGGPATGIAVDPGTNSLYVALGTSVAEYNIGTGEREGTFGVGALTETARIAVNSSTGKVYVSDRGKGKIAIFGPTIVLPTTITGSATAVTSQGATLNGVVNPKGHELDACTFEYGETTGYGHAAPCENPNATEIGSGEASVPVHASISGLQAGHSYHFR
jgi:DNA-binding beta-propeller fold protein YncE